MIVVKNPGVEADIGGNRRETLEEHLAALRPLQAALKAQQLRADDQRTARQLIDELYDEHGSPK